MKIKGYRTLSDAENALINRIKEHAETTERLIEELFACRARAGVLENGEVLPAFAPVPASLPDTEDRRCLALGRTNMQQGYMWLVRGIAMPTGF